MTKPSKSYWDVKDASLNVIVVRQGFKRKSDVTKDMQAFKKTLDEALANFTANDVD